jgi:hypothetical protein
MREYHFKWNTEWNRELDETTGSYADRAAEIGNVLLKNGYCICIHDKTIMDNAITGNYIPEHKKWIYSRKDTSLLAINWGEKNDELYSRARKIKGSKWSSPSVVVDVSHYKAIEKFAEENDFRFTKNAIQKIENYKKQMENIKEVTV